MPRGKPKEGHEKKKSGRPRIYDAEVLADELLIYVESTDDPMIEEFCIKRKMTRDTIYRLAKENERLSDTIKYCHMIQEVRTVRGAQNGIINPTFAIFKLKQKCYGWTDKTEVQSTNVNIETEMTAEEAEQYLKSLGIKV